MNRIILTAAAIAALALPTVASAGDAAKGAELFNANCMSCHGMTGKGDGPVGAALSPPPRDFSVGDFAFDTDGDGKTGTDADLTNVISKGAGAFGGSPLMAPWAHLGDESIADLIAHIRTLKQ